MPSNAFIALSMISMILCGTPVMAEESEPVSMEFLEFLGEWESSEGEWIDPTEVDEMLSSDEEEAGEEND